VLSFYIGNGDRLLRFEMNADMEYDGEHTIIEAMFEFGNSIEDNWMFFVRVGDGDNSNVTFVQWDYEEISDMGFYINNITLFQDDIEPITFKSQWNQDSGDFVLAYIGSRDNGEFAGVLTMDENDFRLRLDDVLPADSDDSLMIEISTETGVQIDEIRFINIDKWGSSLIQSVMRLVLSGIFS